MTSTRGGGVSDPITFAIDSNRCSTSLDGSCRARDGIVGSRVQRFAPQEAQDIDHVLAYGLTRQRSVRQGLDDRAVAPLRRWRASAHQNGCSGTLGPLAIRAHQSGLADAGRSRHQREAPIAGTSLVMQFEQSTQLRTAADEPGGFGMRPGAGNRS